MNPPKFQIPGTRPNKRSTACRIFAPNTHYFIINSNIRNVQPIPKKSGLKYQRLPIYLRRGGVREWVLPRDSARRLGAGDRERETESVASRRRRGGGETDSDE